MDIKVVNKTLKSLTNKINEHSRLIWHQNQKLRKNLIPYVRLYYSRNSQSITARCSKQLNLLNQSMRHASHIEMIQ